MNHLQRTSRTEMASISGGLKKDDGKQCYAIYDSAGKLISWSYGSCASVGVVPVIPENLTLANGQGNLSGRFI